jgi:hypothetical protein
MEDHKEESVVVRRNSIQEMKAHMSDQDFKQKLNMYIAFGMEFYRVIMGSFIVLFVPQQCGDDICSLTANINTGDILKNTAFSFNIITFFVFLHMYYSEIARENTMINYLHVNPEKSRDNESVGESIAILPVEKVNQIHKLDKYYQTSGRVAMATFMVNSTLSTIVVLTQYLDDKTLTVLLTNILFMSLKLYDTKVITDTDEHIFLSAYLTRKIQYNDADPDQVEECNESLTDTMSQKV